MGLTTVIIKAGGKPSPDPYMQVYAGSPINDNFFLGGGRTIATNENAQKGPNPA